MGTSLFESSIFRSLKLKLHFLYIEKKIKAEYHELSMQIYTMQAIVCLKIEIFIKHAYLKQIFFKFWA